MKLVHKILAAGVGLAMICLIWQPVAGAQALPAKPTIVFNSFTGAYHLSRDANGRSLLTTEEVVLADFPGNGNFTGITRAIPQRYQGRSVEVKVLNVTDAAGNPVPFKISSDKDDNLVVTTGDPAITLYGFQTIKINYQTRGVINLNTPQNQFLLDVNGRGWDQGFSQVSAVVHIPSSFQASLISKPNCYIGYLNSSSYDCTITSQKLASETLITSKAQGPLGAHHTLVIKLEFKPATFTNKKDFWSRRRMIEVAAASIGVILISYGFSRYIKRRWS